MYIMSLVVSGLRKFVKHFEDYANIRAQKNLVSITIQDCWNIFDFLFFIRCEI